MVLLSKILREAEGALREVQGQKVVILLGGTGTGKTTFLHFLAGSTLQRRADGKYEAVDALPELRGFDIGHFAKSETKNLRTFQAADMGSTIVDTCGYQDTTNPAVDFAMSILFRKIAENCSGIRFVLLVDHSSLESHRGEQMRTYARLVGSLVAFQEHKEAWSFIFTKIPPPQGSGSDALGKMRLALAERIADIHNHTSDADSRRILKFMCEDIAPLESEEDEEEEEEEEEVMADPLFVDVFHPEFSRREDLLRMVSPDDSPGNKGEPVFMTENPGSDVRCGLTVQHENLLRVSLDDLDKELQGILEQEEVDISQAEQNVKATKSLVELLDLRLLQDSWNAIQRNLQNAVDRLSSQAVSSIKEDRVVQSKQLIFQLHKFAGLGHPNAGRAAEQCLEQHLQCLAKDFESLQTSSVRNINLTTLISKLTHLDLWAQEFDTHSSKLDQCKVALEKFIASLTQRISEPTEPKEPDCVLCQLALLRAAEMESSALVKIGVDFAFNYETAAAVTRLQIVGVQRHGAVAVNLLHQVLRSEEPHIDFDTFKDVVKRLETTKHAAQRYHNLEIKQAAEEQWQSLAAETLQTYAAVRGAVIEKLMPLAPCSGQDPNEEKREAPVASLRAVIRNLDGLHRSLPTVLHETRPVLDAHYREVCSATVRVLQALWQRLEHLCRSMEESKRVHRVQEQLDLLEMISQLEWLDEGELGARIRAQSQGKQVIPGSISELRKDFEKRYHKLWQEHMRHLRTGLSDYLQQPSVAHEEPVETAWELCKAASLLCKTNSQLTSVVQQLLREFLTKHELRMKKYQPLDLKDLENFPADSGNSVLSLKDLTLSSVLPDLQQVCAFEEDYWKKVALLIFDLFDASGTYNRKGSVLRTINRWSAHHHVLGRLPTSEDLQQKVLSDIEEIHDQVEETLKCSDVAAEVAHQLEQLEQIISMEVPRIRKRAENKLRRLTNLVDLKKDEVVEAVEECIRMQRFAKLPSLVQPPASKDERLWQKFRGVLGKVSAALDAQCIVDIADATAATQVWMMMLQAKKDIGEYMKLHADVDIDKKLHSIRNAIEEHLRSLCLQAESHLAKPVTDFQQLRHAQCAAAQYGNKVHLTLEADAKVWGQLLCLEKDAKEKVSEVGNMIGMLIEGIRRGQQHDSRLYKILTLAAHQQLPEYALWQRQLRESLEDLHTGTNRDHRLRPNFKDVILFYQNLLQEWQGGLDKHVPGLPFDIQAELKLFEAKEDQRLASLRRGQWDPCKYLELMDPSPEILKCWMWGVFRDNATGAAVHYSNQFRADVDNLISNIEESLTHSDIAGLRSLLEAAKSLNKASLKKHLERPWTQWERLAETQHKCRRDFAKLCTSAASQVSCGDYRGCSASLKSISEYLREVAPLANVLTVPEVRALCMDMHVTFSTTLQKKILELEMRCQALGYRSIRKSMEDLRSLAGLMTGDFAVYVEDLREVLETGDGQQLDKVMSLMEEAFVSEDLWQLGPSFSILELPTHGCDCAAISSQRRKLVKKYHSDKCHLHRDKVMKRVNQAADRLSRLGHHLGEYQRLLQNLFSEKVRSLPDFIVDDIRGLLERRLYDEAKRRSEALAAFDLVTELVREPAMDAKDTRRRVSKEVQNYVSDLGPQALKHCNGENYRELQRDLEALDSCIDAFSSGYDAIHKGALNIRKEVAQTVTARIEEKAKSSWETLNLPAREEQMKRFAQNLLDLGQVWSELTEFRNRVRKHIDSLLSTCLESSQKGPLYLHQVGLILSRGEAGGRADQSTNSTSVGQQIIKTFVQFKNVQVMLWNQSVRKTQLGPQECIEQMEMKDIFGNSQLEKEPGDLMQGLGAFREHYDMDLKRWMDQHLTVHDLVNSVKLKATAAANKHTSRSGLDIAAARPDLLPLLAGIFLHYTITTSGDSYLKLKEASQATEKTTRHMDLGEMLVTPHNTQILAVLVMLGYGRGRSLDGARSLNHLVQVRTGEGKSLILGAMSTLFALLGFRVCCVCYSHYLSNRDRNAFLRTFTDFQVTHLVRYSRITDYSEETAARRGDIRELTRRMLGVIQEAAPAPKAPANARPSREEVPEVLLVDEVDVLFSEDFYGNTRNPVVRVPDEDAFAILQDLWFQRRKLATHEELYESVKQSGHYKRLAQKYSCLGGMIDAQVAKMCSDLLEYRHGRPPRPIIYEGKIGYQETHGISFSIIDGYKTAFAHLDHRRSLTAMYTALKDALCLIVPCGQFSYGNFQPTHMFGVSGTVNELNTFQRKAIAKYGIESYSILPSVYGHNSTKFLELDNAIEIVPPDTFFLRIARRAEDKVRPGEHRRSVLVFFQDAEMLGAFLKSKEASNLVAPNVLQESLPDSLKEHYIRKAATMGQVTLATAIFGRGCNFACFDEQMRQNGGMHVIQTFVSQELSEEVQIKGRTARQGQSGTFSMILDANDLFTQLGLPASVSQQGLQSCYKAINQARQSKHQAYCQSMQQTLDEATRNDKETDAYFTALLHEDWATASRRFQKVWNNTWFDTWTAKN